MIIIGLSGLESEMERHARKHEYVSGVPFIRDAQYRGERGYLAEYACLLIRVVLRPRVRVVCRVPHLTGSIIALNRNGELCLSMDVTSWSMIAEILIQAKAEERHRNQEAP